MKRIKIELKSSISNNNTLENEYSWLIVANGEEVGCANLVRQNFEDDFLVLDMEIKENSKNKKIKKKALDKISKLNIEDFILMKENGNYLPIVSYK